ncbi:MAG: type 1 glutamine amidotransferase domain-containing protein [Armatimonadota bacterium]|jgi:protease I
MNIDGKRIAILVADAFEDVELTEPREQLVNAGARTFIVGIEAGTTAEGKHGTTVEIEYAAGDVGVGDFDALVIPGGQAPEKLRLSEGVLDLVRRADEAGRPIAAICHAPLVLASAGLLDGRRATSYAGVIDDIANAGAEAVDEPAVVDGNLITSRNPDDIDAFVEAIVAALQ